MPEILGETLQVMHLERDQAGDKVEPEAQPARRLLSVSAETGTTGGAQPDGQLATSISIEMPAHQLAAAVTGQCWSCVAEGTLVLADGRPQLIEDVVRNRAAKTLGPKGTWDPIAAHMATGTKDIMEVVTTRGMKVLVTPDHRIHTERGWTAAADLRALSYAPSGRRFPGEQVDTFSEHQFSTKDVIPREDAFLVGALTGDGWIMHRQGEVIGVGFCYCPEMKSAWAPLIKHAMKRLDARSDNRPFLRDYKRLGNALVGNKPRNGIYEAVWRTEAARQLGRWLDKAHIPSEIWASTPECMGAYLRGLFSTDGSMTLNPTAMFYQVTKSLIDEVQLMLRSLGIFSSVSSSNRPPYQALYQLTIARQDSLERFIDLVGFVDTERNGPLTEVVMSRRGKGHAAPECIRSVTPQGQAQVYDLTVPKTSSFYANGVLVHNCKNFDNRAWKQLLRKLMSTKDGMMALNKWRAALMTTGNAAIRDAHEGADGEMDVEHALQALGICHPMTEVDGVDPVVVYPAGSCPPDGLLPGTSKPFPGAFSPITQESERQGSAAFDRIMRAAQGK